MKKQTITARRFCCVALLLPGLILTAVPGGSFCFPSPQNSTPFPEPAAHSYLSRQEAPSYLSENSTQPVLPEDKTVLNILLIGQDTHVDDSPSRSDTMILCTFRPEDGTLILTSFLRDLYVKIPGYQNNRLNAAYAFGGAKLLRKTLEKNFAVPIDGTVEVNFSCFPDVIDLLGGVTLELRQDEANVINRAVPNSHLTEGLQLLTGQQALAYSRIRSLDADGDFSRTRRQRKVLLALMDGYRDAGLIRGLRIVKKVLPFVSTDMSQDTIVGYAARLVPVMADMKVSSQTIPAPGAYACRNIRGMAVLVADMEAARKLLEETVRE